MAERRLEFVFLFFFFNGEGRGLSSGDRSLLGLCRLGVEFRVIEIEYEI